MTFNGWTQIAIFFLLILACAKPLGGFIATIIEGKRNFLTPVLAPVERLIYRLCGIALDANGDPEEQHWTRYAGALLAFSAFSAVLLYVIQRMQLWLPFNPQGYSAGNVSPDLGFNTSVSFTTNTNWQSYTPETTLSYFVQMAGLTVHNFTSAAAGLAIAIALVRGFARQSVKTIGNFWADMTRATLYVLLPISIVAALVLCSQGVIQNLHPYTVATTLEGAKQTIAQGPVASQEAIKMLGTNGGGFFNANSAHPFENPTPFTNMLETFLIFLIPGALTYTFGKMVRDTRQGWALFAAMSLLWLGGVVVAYHYEQRGTPLLASAGIQMAASDGAASQPGGNMEGKETRFGIADTALFATVTTDASCGAVNSMHDSFTPLGGLVPLFNIQLGEVAFGGVGAGLYGMLMFAILGVFIAGLMVGRTPEYLGKKIEQKEVKMAMIAMLVLAASILLFAGASAVVPTAVKSTANPGAHGLSEILYAFSSATGNNGSAFAGLSANTPYYNVTLGFAMLIGRFLMLLPLLAVAGSLAAKKHVPVSAGTFPTHGPLFVGLLVGVVVIVGALTYFPALSLGPIAEHLML
ncbi:MAG TPA: potassium-transporting ATPase subunit KdpA [Bryobacteraceae bacterium]|nr:potassium-transporting ATPase subunit KdpA [Bryobacteraceae bacterium]